MIMFGNNKKIYENVRLHRMSETDNLQIELKPYSEATLNAECSIFYGLAASAWIVVVVSQVMK